MFKGTKKQAKTLASSLRRALATQSNTEINHSGAQELIAKTFGFKNWSAFEASLSAQSAPASPVVDETAAAKYPLVNRGQFDFEDGEVVLTGAEFETVSGTLVDIRSCTAQATDARRLSDGTLDVEYAGETEINWDEVHSARDAAGFALWVREDGFIVSEAQCVLMSTDYEDGIGALDPEFDAPVRSALITAFITYLTETEVIARVIEELATDLTGSLLISQAVKTLGFQITYPERVALLQQLRAL